MAIGFGERSTNLGIVDVLFIKITCRSIDQMQFDCFFSFIFHLKLEAVAMAFTHF